MKQIQRKAGASMIWEIWNQYWWDRSSSTHLGNRNISWEPGHGKVAWTNTNRIFQSLNMLPCMCEIFQHRIASIGCERGFRQWGWYLWSRMSESSIWCLPWWECGSGRAPPRLTRPTPPSPPSPSPAPPSDPPSTAAVWPGSTATPPPRPSQAPPSGAAKSGRGLVGAVVVEEHL